MEKENKKEKNSIWKDKATPLSQRTTSSGVRFCGEYENKKK